MLGGKNENVASVNANAIVRCHVTNHVIQGPELNYSLLLEATPTVPL